MSRSDLEGIIRSPSAETFLRMVTKGFYDNSYIGLWMYEAIGREWDEMRKWAEGLKDEINPQTCTWSIGIWEWVYGIETDEALQLEYRRQRILAKILWTKPVNPEVIRRGVVKITGCDVDITDFAGPYRFALKIHMQEDGETLPYGLVREYIQTVKPSHLAAFLTWMFLVVIDSTQLEQFLHPLVQMHWYIPFWGCKILNGTKFLDGSALLNAGRRYRLVLGIKNGIKLSISESMDTDRVYIDILSCFNVHESINSLKAVFGLGRSGFWFPGSGNVSGGYNMPLKMSVPVKARAVQGMDAVSLANGIIKLQAEEKTGAALGLKASVNYWQDGREPQAVKGQALKAQTKHMAEMNVSEAVGDVTITYRRHLHYLDGSKCLDGTQRLDAFYGKEDI